MWGDIAIAFLLAFITAFVITPYTMRLAKKVGAIDIPNERRVNKKPMPRLGGVAVILGFLVSCIYLIITMLIEKKLSIDNDKQYLIQLLGFFIGIIILSIVCFIDDAKGVHPLIKLSAQIVAAIIVVLCDVKIDIINIPFAENGILINKVLTYILTVGWIVGITNAINLIDGLDRIIFRNFIDFVFVIINYFCIKWSNNMAYYFNYSISRRNCWIFTI